MVVEVEGPVLIGIDVGTSSVRSIAFERRGRRIAAAARPTPTKVLATGGEYDPDAIFEAVLATLSEIGAKLNGRPVAGIAVASVGESCVLIDADGKPVAPSIVWHDRRTEPQAEAIFNAVGRERVFEINGHAIEPIYTLAKLLWMREHWAETFATARRVLMMADWIAFRLSGEAATDPSLASRTLYYDLRHDKWSEELLALAGVDTDFPARIAKSGTPLGAMLPDVVAATGLAGRPVIAVGGHDHIVGALATGLSEPGSVIDSIGTAEAVLLATGSPLTDPETVNRGYVQGVIESDRRLCYLAGSILSSGGSFEWLRAVVGSPEQQSLVEAAAQAPVGSDGVVFVPHLANAPPPVPDSHARGAFLGLTQTTSRGALARAVLEGIAMQSRLMLDGMTGLPGVSPAGEIRLIGGGARNPLFLQIKANVLARPLIVVEESEGTALGAALLGGVGAGLFASFDAAWKGLERTERVVEPEPAQAERYETLRASVFAPLMVTLRPVNRSITDFVSAGRD